MNVISLRIPPIFLRLYKWATKPDEHIQEPHQRRRAQLLSTILIVLIPLAALTSSIPFVMGSGGITVIIVAPAGILLLIVAYMLSRTRDYRWGATVLVGTLLIGTITATAIDPQDNVVAAGFGILGILAADLFLSRKTTSVVAAANVSALIVIIILATDPLARILLTVVVMLIIMVMTLAIVHGRVRMLDERDQNASLMESEERHRLLLETAFEGYYVREHDKIISASPGLGSLLGYSSESLVGKDERTLFASATAPDQLAMLIPGESYEMIAQRVDGTPINVEVIHIDHMHEQRPVQVVGLHDITYQKGLDHLKRKFVADVTHELRTPITTMGLYMKLLDHAPAEKQSEYMNVLRAQVKRLSKLSSDVLTISILDAHSLRQASVPISLNQIVESTVNLYEPSAREAGLSIQCHLDSALPSVPGNGTELEIILSNLLSNAIAFTKHGGIQITTRRSQSGEECILEVTDTGIGIHEEDLPHIFERFYRGKLESQSNLPGAGLGLSLVQQIVENHRGRVEVESQLGKGTTLRVILPSVDGD